MHQICPCVQVGLNGFGRSPAERDNAFLPAFADNAHKPLAEADIPQVERD